MRIHKVNFLVSLFVSLFYVVIFPPLDSSRAVSKVLCMLLLKGFFLGFLNLYVLCVWILW